MSVFESTAVLDDPRHLTLGRPVPDAAARECRVIVMFDMISDTDAGARPERGSWPQGFLEEIRVEDAAFERPVQGTVPAIAPLDA